MEMERDELKREHGHVKSVLSAVSDFISSDGYYALPYHKRQLYAARKASLETYLNTLSVELWGGEAETVDVSSLMLAMMSPALFSGVRTASPMSGDGTAAS